MQLPNIFLLKKYFFKHAFLMYSYFLNISFFLMDLMPLFLSYIFLNYFLNIMVEM